MGKKDLPKTVGDVYAEAAWGCFRERYPEMSVVEVSGILNRRDFDEIESYIHLANLFKAGVKKLRQELKKDNIMVPRDFLMLLLYSDKPREDARRLITELKLHDYMERDISRIAIQMLKAIHDEWVIQYKDDFFDPKRMWQRSRFMPFELIGLDPARRYRIVFDEIAMVLGWKVHTETLRALYWRLQDDFHRKNLLRTHEDLPDYLRRAEYKSLSPEIVKALKDDPAIAIQMAYS